MRVDNKIFIEKVRKLYRKDPCYISSIALFKTEKILLTSDTYEVIHGKIHYLYAIKDNKLIFYWSNQNEVFYFSKDKLNQFDVMVIHDHFYQIIKDVLDNSQCEKMYPLIYTGKEKDVLLDQEFIIKDFKFEDEKEFNDAKDLINAAYPGHKHTIEEVKSWMELPAFYPLLWFWIVYQETGEKAALGISAYQASIKETYLDWIQVHPNFHKNGLGKALVYETIKRSYPISKIIRVTGRVDEFYLRCGFQKKEKWWFIKNG